MSYWVSLKDENGENLLVSAHEEGGACPVDGTEEATMNVTYNYSVHYVKVLNEESGLRWLNERKARDTVDRLRSACKLLDDDEVDNYWEATEGNAKRPLRYFLAWAIHHPKGTWRVS